MTAQRTLDFQNVALHVTRIVVLGGLLLVALAGCGRQTPGNVQRGPLRFASSRRPTPPVAPGTRRVAGPPVRGPLR